jgi:hypothetical protein
VWLLGADESPPLTTVICRCQGGETLRIAKRFIATERREDRVMDRPALFVVAKPLFRTETWEPGEEHRVQALEAEQRVSPLCTCRRRKSSIRSRSYHDQHPTSGSPRTTGPDPPGVQIATQRHLTDPLPTHSQDSRRGSFRSHGSGHVPPLLPLSATEVAFKSDLGVCGSQRNRRSALLDLTRQEELVAETTVGSH